MSFESDKSFEIIGLPQAYVLADTEPVATVPEKGVGDKLHDAFVAPVAENPLAVVAIVAGVAALSFLGNKFKNREGSWSDFLQDR